MWTQQMTVTSDAPERKRNLSLTSIEPLRVNGHLTGPYITRRHGFSFTEFLRKLTFLL